MDNSKILDLYRSIRRIRLTEETIADNYYNEVREMHTPIHLCDGEEAIAVGICSNLSSKDMMFSNHRCHGHYLAMGGDLNALIAELHGKITGCCKGKGGSMHLCDLDKGIMLTSAIVAGNVSIATGYALAQKLGQKEGISVVFFGDGASEEGSVYESICFAVKHKIPVLYVCENNRIAISTPFPLREPGENVSCKFSSIIPSTVVDGNDVCEVFDYAKSIIDDIRHGQGPHLIECNTYRLRAHSNIGDGVDNIYRTTEERTIALKNDPCANLKTVLITEGIKQAVLNNIDSKIRDEIQSAFENARKSVLPEPCELYSDVFS